MLNPLKIGRLTLSGIFVLIILAGCGRTNIQPMGSDATNVQLSKPSRILVSTFAVSPKEVSLDSAIGSRLERYIEGEPPTEEEERVGRAVAYALAESLVKDLEKDGFLAERVSKSAQPATDELLIVGYFLTVQEGNRLRRTVIGFGLGKSELKALVQVYQGSEGGRLLAKKFEVSSESSLKPGMGPFIGVGAIAGTVAGSAAVSGGVGLATEARQTVKGDADRMAKVIAKKLSDLFKN